MKPAYNFGDPLPKEDVFKCAQDEFGSERVPRAGHGSSAIASSFGVKKYRS